MTTTDARVLDARVAELVMGWRAVYVSPHGPLHPRVHEGPLDRLDFWDTSDGRRMPCGWSPITDPAADYAVLRHVRETWDTDAQYRFAQALAELYRPRKEGNHPILRYMPGDYSRAALAVMEGE